MDCGGVFVKYALFIANILVVIFGILLVTFGSIMLAQMGSYSNISEAFDANSVSIAIVALGSVIFLIAFMGCCGAIRENSCLLMSYSVVMLGLFLCQIGLIVYVWLERPDMLSAMDKIVKKIWEQHESDQALMDAFQISFKCCGYHSFADYADTLPASCCGAEATSCSILNAMVRPGCSRAFNTFWDNNINIIRYVGLGVAAVELTVFIFTCCLANQIRNNRRRSQY